MSNHILDLASREACVVHGMLQIIPLLLDGRSLVGLVPFLIKLVGAHGPSQHRHRASHALALDELRNVQACSLGPLNARLR